MIKMPLDFSSMISSAQAGDVLKPVVMRTLNSPTFKGFDVDVEPFTTRAYDGWFHPSTHSLLTLRQLYLYLTQPDRLQDEGLDITGVLAVTAGKFWHRFFQLLWLEDGVLLRDEYPVRDPLTRRRGSVDGLLRNGEALEIKTINDFQILKIDNETILKEKKPGYWCLPTDITEVLTPIGWRMLRDIKVGDSVASWANGEIHFAEALGVVDPYVADTVSVADIEMTSDHRVYYMTPGGVKVMTAAEVQQVRESEHWFVPTCGHYDGPGLGIGHDLLRLLVWVQADGSYKRLKKDGPVYGMRFHFAKQRKVERVVELLTTLGAKFSVNPTKAGTTSIYVSGKEWMEQNILRWLPEKVWTWDLLSMSDSEFKVFQDELFLADGSINKTKGLVIPPREYYSIVDQNLDVVQALLVMHETSARKHQYNSGGRVSEHSRRAQGRLLGGSYKEGRIGVEVSCLTTVDGTVVVRQHGQVRVVGNCQTQDYLDILGIDTMRYFTLAPTYPFHMGEFTVKADRAYQIKRRNEYMRALELAEQYPDGSAADLHLTLLPTCCGPGSAQSKKCFARLACPVGRFA